MQYNRVGGMQYNRVGVMQYNRVGGMQYNRLGGVQYNRVGGMQYSLEFIISIQISSQNFRAERQMVAKWQDGVKVLWCHSHLVWLVFEASIPTCTCFPSENFL